jgi:DNA-directed RNA polymerase specialized sigma24 family protein
MTDRERLLDELRPASCALAYRMLGSVAEAEDVVQEALLQVHQALALRCEEAPFETMLTAVVFCARVLDQWELTGGHPIRLLTDGWIATGQANEYVVDLVLSAREGLEPAEPIPGHPAEQQHLTMILGRLTAASLRLLAAQCGRPLVVALQDLLVSVQRVAPPPATAPAWARPILQWAQA